MSVTEEHHDPIIPIPRNRVFVLLDGTFVVQWEENLVQVLLSGRYLNYSSTDFGNPITNWELNQLKQAGVIAGYDDELVQLQQQPELNQQSQKRSYYLNTTLPRNQIKVVESVIQDAQLDHRFSVRMHDRYIIVRSENGTAFDNFDVAENAREILVANAPDIFSETVVAFVEIVGS